MYRRNRRPSNPLKQEIIDVIDRQIKNDDPVYVKDIFTHLHILTGSEAEAKELIGGALVEEMHEMMTDQEPFNDERYHNRLNRIFDQFDKEEVDITDAIVHHPFARMHWEMNRVDIDSVVGRPEEYRKRIRQRAEIFWEYWKTSVREWMKERGNNGTVAIDDIGDDIIIRSDEIQVIIDNAEMDLLNSGMHEERIAFLKDLLDFINWEDSSVDNSDNYRGYIGESINALGRYEEADKYFKSLLAEDPDNDEYRFRYVIALYDRGDYNGARGLMEQSISPDTEITDGNSSLFDWAPEIYEKVGETDKADAYRKKLDEWSNEEASKGIVLSATDSFTAECLKLGKNEFLAHGINVDLEKNSTNVMNYSLKNGRVISQRVQKIYPNDPCPCGSGKKYKKCCGRKK